MPTPTTRFSAFGLIAVALTCVFGIIFATPADPTKVAALATVAAAAVGGISGWLTQKGD